MAPHKAWSSHGWLESGQTWVQAHRDRERGTGSPPALAPLACFRCSWYRHGRAGPPHPPLQCSRHPLCPPRWPPAPHTPSWLHTNKHKARPGEGGCGDMEVKGSTTQHSRLEAPQQAQHSRAPHLRTWPSRVPSGRPGASGRPRSCLPEGCWWGRCLQACRCWQVGGALTHAPVQCRIASQHLQTPVLAAGGTTAPPKVGRCTTIG